MTTGISKTIKAWIPVLLVGMCAFIFVTSEMMPVGLLPDISTSIGHSEATTGLLVTGYAWVVMLFSLPLTLATASTNRRQLLLLLIGIFFTGNLLCSIADSFAHLFLSRIVIASTHCIFWAITPPLATRLAPEGGEGLGLAVIGGGSILAAVLGVPLGTFIGHQFGWRLAFAFIGGIAFLIGTILFFLLPTLPSKQTGNWGSLPLIFKNKNLIAAYGVIAFIVSGHFFVYTYFVPYLQKVFNLHEQAVVYTLLVVGLSGAVGILLGGLFALKHLRLMMILSASVILGMMILVYSFQFSYAISLACMIAWSVAMSMIGLCFQVWILDLAPNAKDAATALMSGIFNFGIGGGALYGSITLRYMGVEWLPLIASFLILPGIVLIIRFVKNPKFVS
jgi:DHA1 family purine ribonucleoside efflux pump-like MFS transporter/DHA1 family L-arabinose/isopropyl-beta-D-thiogalactopyranoside export protein-like MFS transporter